MFHIHIISFLLRRGGSVDPSLCVFRNMGVQINTRGIERFLAMGTPIITGVSIYNPGVHLMSGNPRQTNGSLRRKHRARFKAMAAPCGICKGRLGPIHYDEPSDSAHPLSFVIDEVRPVSRWKQYGYPSARACAEDWNNLQAAHYCCNQAKGNKVNFTKLTKIEAVSGDW